MGGSEVSTPGPGPAVAPPVLSASHLPRRPPTHITLGCPAGAWCACGWRPAPSRTGAPVGVRGEVRVTVRGRGTVAPPVWRKPGRRARPGRNIYRLAEAEGRPELALAGRAVGRIGRSLGMAVTRVHVARRLARDLQDARRFEGERLDGWPDLTRDLRRAHARGGHGAPRRRAGGLPSADGSSRRTAYGPEAYILVDEHDGDVRAGGESLECVLNLRGCRLCGQTSTGRGEEGCGC